MGRSSSEAPATASSSSTSRGTWCGALGETLWRCLDDSCRRWRRPRAAPSRRSSDGDDSDVHRKSISGRASCSRHTSRRSATVASRTSPVASSATSVPSPSAQQTSGAVAAEHDVVRRVAPGQQHGAGRRAQAVLDERSRQPREAAVAVHVRAASLEHVERALRGERDPDVLEHPQRLLVDEVTLARGERRCCRPAHGPPSRCVRTRRSSVTAASVKPARAQARGSDGRRGRPLAAGTAARRPDSR